MKEIPNTAGFLCDENGQVFDKHLRARNSYKNGDGYVTASVCDLKGKWKTFGVHRLVALTFLPCPGDPDDYTVNHRDHNKLNNNVNNLEWLTVKDNNVHSALHRGTKQNPKIVATLPDGTMQYVSNLKTAEKMFSINSELIWDSIRDNKKILDHRFVSCLGKQKKPVELHIAKKMAGERYNGKLVPRKIKVKDLRDQKVLEFNSMLDAAVYFNTKTTHILKSVSTELKKHLFLRNYLVVDSNSEFPELTQEEYESLLNPTGKEVIAWNKEQKLINIFSSASDFITKYSLSKKAVTTRLKKNMIKDVSGWIFLYKTQQNVERLFSVIGCSEP